MKKAQSVALVCAGTISRAEITRIPNLIRRLGPVKAARMRIASRAANALHAGYPVANYEDLNGSPLILIAAPETWALEFLAEMREAAIDWADKSLVVTGSYLDSSALRDFEVRGASVASLHIFEFPTGPLCIAEGCEAAVKALKGITGPKIVRVRQGEMPFCFAALALATHCFLPLIDAGVEALVQSGMDAPQAQLVSDKLLVRSLRAYSKAGRQAWSPLGRDFLAGKIAKIELGNPQLAAYCAAMFEAAVQWMNRDAGAGAAATGQPDRQAG